MDRRKLIVGGGAAAVATTLGAMAGSAPAQAAPVLAGFRPASTADHARLVLRWARADLGLVNPAGLHRRFEEFHAAFTALPPREPRLDDPEAWLKGRLKDLCGTDSYAEVYKLPQARTLMAFSLLVYSQNQDRLPQPVDPREPFPPTAATLEPDFFPVLLELVNEKRRTSREFAAGIDAAANELDLIIEAKVRELLDREQADSKGGGGIVVMADNGAAIFTAVMCVALWFLMSDWIKDQFSK